MPVRFPSYIIALLMFLCGCKNDEQDHFILSSINESLEASAKNISNENVFFYKTLNERLTDPKTIEISKIWQPKAETVHKLSSDLFIYIDKIKNTFKKNTTQNYNLEQATELYKFLNYSKKEMLSVDSEIYYHFYKTSDLINSPNDTTINNSSTFYNKFFKNTSSISILTNLSKFQNNLKIVENNIARYCFYKTTPIIHGFTKYGILIGQNTTHLKAGELLQIDVGIGAFSSAAMPLININGKTTQCIDGHTTFKLKASNKIGKHYVPVKIEYIDLNGVKKNKNTEIEYTVDE